MKLKNMLNKINNRVQKQDHRSNDLQMQLNLLRSTVEKLWTKNSDSSAAFTTDGTFVSGSKVSVNGHTIKATDKAPVYAKDSTNLNDNTNEAVSYSNPNGTVTSVADANNMTILIQENNRVTSYFLTRNKQETKGDN